MFVGFLEIINVASTDRLDLGHLHPLLEQPKTYMSRRESNPGLRDGKRLSILEKSYSNRFLNSFSEHLHETATLLKLFKLFKLSYSSSHHIAIFNDLKLQFYERQISGVSKFGGI
jgi:hypothetical protein